MNGEQTTISSISNKTTFRKRCRISSLGFRYGWESEGTPRFRTIARHKMNAQAFADRASDGLNLQSLVLH